MKLLGHFFAGFMLLVCVASCSLKNPEMPTWDVTVDLPLINQFWYVSDLVDSVHFFQDGNDVYFSSHGEINSFLLNDLKVHTNANVSIPIVSGMPTYSGSIALNAVNPEQDSIKIAYGNIQAGYLTVYKSSETPNFGSAVIVFDELYNQNGHLTITINDSSPTTIPIDLSNFTIGNINNTTTMNQLHFTITPNSTLPAGTNMCQVNLVLNQDINFVNFKGTIEHRFLLDVLNDTSDIDIDYPLGIENAIQIHNASLQINLLNEIGFDCEFFGRLYAFNDSTGQSAVIDILDNNHEPFVIHAAESETEPTMNTFILDNNNGLNELTNIIPTRFYVSNAYFKLLTSNDELGFARVGQRVSGSYVEKVPFNFTLFDAWITPQRLDSLEIAEENRSRIRDNFNDASLLLKIKNQLPVGMSFEMYFSSNPDVMQFPQLIRTGSLSAGGYDSPFQSIPISLSHEDLQVFDVPKLYYKIRIHLNATEGPVSITGSSSDYLQFIGRIKLNMTVEEEK